MSDKFHVSADGTPHQCFASIRPCPLGGQDEHYASETEARAAFESSMASETFTPLSKGYTITALIPVSAPRMENGSGGSMQQLPVKGDFETPKDAVEWAKANLRDSTSLITLRNEEWDITSRVNENGQVKARTGDPMETGDFASLNLIDISEDREVFETKDVPTIGKFLIKKYGKNIQDERTLKVFSNSASSFVDQHTLSRIRAYVRAGTFGVKKTDR